MAEQLCGGKENAGLVAERGARSERGTVFDDGRLFVFAFVFCDEQGEARLH